MISSDRQRCFSCRPNWCDVLFVIWQEKNQQLSVTFCHQHQVFQHLIVYLFIYFPLFLSFLPSCRHAAGAPFQSPGCRGSWCRENVYYQAVRSSDLLPALQNHHRGWLRAESSAVGQWHCDPAAAVGHSRSASALYTKKEKKSNLLSWYFKNNLRASTYKLESTLTWLFCLWLCQKLEQ